MGIRKRSLRSYKAATKLADENANLIRWFISKKGVRPQDFMDIFQDLFMVVQHASLKWDRKKSKYSTYIGRAMINWWKSRGEHLELIRVPRYAFSEKAKPDAKAFRQQARRCRTLPANWDVQQHDDQPNFAIDVDDLKKAMKLLSKEDRKLIGQRFFKKQTLLEISKEHNCTHENVRQKQVRILLRLRSILSQV